MLFRSDAAKATPARENAAPGAPRHPDGAKSERTKGHEQAGDLNQQACSDDVTRLAVEGDAQPDQCVPRDRATESTVEAAERPEDEGREQADVKPAESTVETEETTEGTGGQCICSTVSAASKEQRRTDQTTESATQVEEPPTVKTGRQVCGGVSATTTEKRRESPGTGSESANPTIDKEARWESKNCQERHEIGRAHV